MRNAFLFFIALSLAGCLYTRSSGANNRSAYVETVGGSEVASSFARKCLRNMKKTNTDFRDGAPTRRYGCICVAVKMEKDRVLTTENMSAASEAHRDFVTFNRSYMKLFDNGRANLLRLPETHAEHERSLARQILLAHKFCDQYTLTGQPRISQ